VGKVENAQRIVAMALHKALNPLCPIGDSTHLLGSLYATPAHFRGFPDQQTSRRWPGVQSTSVVSSRSVPRPCVCGVRPRQWLPPLPRPTLLLLRAPSPRRCSSPCAPTPLPPDRKPEAAPACFVAPAPAARPPAPADAPSTHARPPPGSPRDARLPVQRAVRSPTAPAPPAPAATNAHQAPAVPDPGGVKTRFHTAGN
jgi:hypothetical protein